MSNTDSDDGGSTDLNENLLLRVDKVLERNSKTEWLYITLAAILFLSGIACIITAICKGQFIWATPSMVTTYFLWRPFDIIRKMRSENIAIATAPAVIQMLPRAKAVEELQKLLQKLYGDDK